VVADRGGELIVAAIPGGFHLGRPEREPAPGSQAVADDGGRQVFVDEDLPDLLGRRLPAAELGAVLHRGGELDLQAARQVEVAGGGQQVGHAPLARLGVHADDRLVGAADVGGVDGQVGHVPGHRGFVAPGVVHLPGTFVEALLDRVLVGAGESRVHQIPAIGVARVHVHLGAVFDGPADVIDVGEVD